MDSGGQTGGHYRAASFEVHPDGIVYRGPGIDEAVDPAFRRTGGGKRGEITGLSSKAVTRMLTWLLENRGPDGADPYAVTLTTRGTYSPAEWRSIIKRFRTTLRRKAPQWAGLWRVELQRRQTPHLHCVIWSPASRIEVYGALRRWWLEAVGEAEDRHSWRYAVRVKECPPGKDRRGWAAYTALHGGKSKAEQLGWQGKQWGVWNADAWQSREPLAVGEPSERWMVTFVRVLRGWDRAQRRGSQSEEVRRKAKRSRIFHRRTGWRRLMPLAAVEAAARAANAVETEQKGVDAANAECVTSASYASEIQRESAEANRHRPDV
jgi:hypothetical protein